MAKNTFSEISKMFSHRAKMCVCVAVNVLHVIYFVEMYQTVSFSPPPPFFSLSLSVRLCMFVVRHHNKIQKKKCIYSSANIRACASDWRGKHKTKGERERREESEIENVSKNYDVCKWMPKLIVTVFASLAIMFFVCCVWCSLSAVVHTN